MSDIIKAKKIPVVQDCVVGKKCDICGKEIPPTIIPHKYGEPVYDYYEVTTHHNDWGNDSVDSYEHFDACSPDCAYKLWEEYIRNSAGASNTMCIEVEHKNYWMLNDAEVSQEVVRCKDCKHATMTSDGKMCKYCAMDTDDYGDPREVYHDADWFCADAKRR